MKPSNPFQKVHEICGGPQATQQLRAGISAFAEEQARHFIGINNPQWVDRAINDPEWGRAELRLCNAARAEAEMRMGLHLAPYCEELAISKAGESEEQIAQVKFTMSRKWTGAKELGSRVVQNFVSRHRGRSPRPMNLHSPPSLTLAPSRPCQREEIELER